MNIRNFEEKKTSALRGCGTRSVGEEVLRKRDLHPERLHPAQLRESEVVGVSFSFFPLFSLPSFPVQSLFGLTTVWYLVLPSHLCCLPPGG